MARGRCAASRQAEALGSPFLPVSDDQADPTTAQVEPRAARGWRFGESETAPPPVRAAAAADPARLLDDLSPRPLGVARCGAQRQAGCPPPTSAARQSVALAVTADE